MKTTLLISLLLTAVLLTGCVAYTGVAVKNNKAYITQSDGTLEVCDVSGAGAFSNCKLK